MIRALRCSTGTALLALMTAATACSAGQVTQTATQVRDHTGGFGEVGDMVVRAVRLAHPPEGVYEPGEQAELRMALVNTGTEDDALTLIDGTFFSGVTVDGSPFPSPAQPDVRSGPVAVLGSSAVRSGGPAPTDKAVNIPVPADEAVFIGTDGPTVMLTGLTERIDAAESVRLTLIFSRAGETTVTAIVDTPARPLPRGPAYEF